MDTKMERMSSTKRLARIAGLFYLLVGIFGGFAEGFGDPKLYVRGMRRQQLGMSWRTSDLSARSLSPTC